MPFWESRAEFLQNEMRRLKPYQGHSQIVGAIESRKTNWAWKAMDEHLQDIEEIILDQKGEFQMMG
jgi:DNA-binding FadR family transcriptional regulator